MAASRANPCPSLHSLLSLQFPFLFYPPCRASHTQTGPSACACRSGRTAVGGGDAGAVSAGGVGWQRRRMAAHATASCCLGCCASPSGHAVLHQRVVLLRRQRRCPCRPLLVPRRRPRCAHRPGHAPRQRRAPRACHPGTACWPGTAPACHPPPLLFERGERGGAGLGWSGAAAGERVCAAPTQHGDTLPCVNTALPPPRTRVHVHVDVQGELHLIQV
jgi:hypothetical protein